MDRSHFFANRMRFGIMRAPDKRSYSKQQNTVDCVHAGSFPICRVVYIAVNNFRIISSSTKKKRENVFGFSQTIKNEREEAEKS